MKKDGRNVQCVSGFVRLKMPCSKTAERYSDNKQQHFAYAMDLCYYYMKGQLS